MPFIGIIGQNKYYTQIKKIISSSLKEEAKQYTIITFNAKNIENIKNIRFETILIVNNNKKVLEQEEVLKNIISNTKYIIINADMEIDLKLLNELNLQVVTFGFNLKSTITASSVNEENLLLCVQRSIKDIHDNIIEPQEININLEDMVTECNANNIMGIASLLLIYGERPDKF